MVYLFERPETARELEGKVQCARLLNWCQYARYTPSTSESRLLMLGLDEVYGRPQDMTFLTTTLAVRLTSLWARMPFFKKWVVPLYCGAFLADRKRAVGIAKADSMYGTLAAIAEIESPLGREARRLVKQADLRLEARKESEFDKIRHFTTKTYMGQIFCFYDWLGPGLGAAVSHFGLWTTFHETFEGSAIYHRVEAGSPEADAVEILKAADELEDEFRNTAASSILGQNRISSGNNKKSKTSERQLEEENSKKKDFSSIHNLTKKDPDRMRRDFDILIKKKIKERDERIKKPKMKPSQTSSLGSISTSQLHTSSTTSSSSASGVNVPNASLSIGSGHAPLRSTIWAGLQLNFRCWTWRVFEVAQADEDDDTSSWFFSLGLPTYSGADDYLLNALQKCGQQGSAIGMNSQWFPARAWYTARLAMLDRKPPPIPELVL